MGTITYVIPTTGTLNSVADPQVATALQTLLTLVNGNVDTNNLSPSAAIVPGQLASSTLGRRLGAEAIGFIPAGTSAGDLIFLAGNTTNTFTGSFNQALCWWYLDPASWAIAGKTAQLVIRMSLMSSAVQAISYTGKLAAVTFTGGATVQPVEGAIAGSTSSVANPAAGSTAAVESSAFAFPSAGAYVPVVTLSGNQSGSGVAVCTWQLFVVYS